MNSVRVVILTAVMLMKLGLPKSLLYYRYGRMWRSFFEQLGCDVVVSGDTTPQILEEGIRHSVGECCLPVKAFLGHVAWLRGRCDQVFVPRCECLAKNEELCVRFWGLPDIVRATFPELNVLSCNVRGNRPGNLRGCVLRLGRQVGRRPFVALHAMRHARELQHREDLALQKEQYNLLRQPGVKVLVAAQPYIVHDPLLGGPIAAMIRGQGAIPVFADRCERERCRALSKSLSTDLYWTVNKEVIGAIPLLREKIDGVVLLTAFPCGTDSLVNELVLRRLRDIPVTHIVLDEQQGEAGLQTRIECFLDIVRERGRPDAS